MQRFFCVLVVRHRKRSLRLMEFISDVPADIVIYEMDQISFQNEFRPVVRFLPEWVVEVCKMQGNEKNDRIYSG